VDVRRVEDVLDDEAKAVFGDGEPNETILPGLPNREQLFVAWHDADTGELLRVAA